MRTFHWLVLGSAIALVAACTMSREAAAPARTAQMPVGTVRDVMKQIVEDSSAGAVRCGRGHRERYKGTEQPSTAGIRDLVVPAHAMAALDLMPTE
jgi:hypothetical protein